MDLPHSLRETLRGSTRLSWFLLLAIGLFVLFLLLPIFLVPSYSAPLNRLALQFSIYKLKDYLVLGLLAVLNALLIMMRIHIFQKKRELRKAIASLGASGAGSVSAIFASILGTVSCASCVFALVGFLGTGAVFFVLRYRWVFWWAILIWLVIAIFMAARQIQNHCNACRVRIKV